MPARPTPPRLHAARSAVIVTVMLERHAYVDLSDWSCKCAPVQVYLFAPADALLQLGYYWHNAACPVYTHLKPFAWVRSSTKQLQGSMQPAQSVDSTLCMLYIATVSATNRRGAALVHTGGPPHVLDAKASEQQLWWLRPLGCELQCQRPVWLVICPPHYIFRQALLVWHLELHACTQSIDRQPPGSRS